jgi:hypothetical protein
LRLSTVSFLAERIARSEADTRVNAIDLVMISSIMEVEVLKQEQWLEASFDISIVSR